jgi:hypothetical protein
MRPGAPPSLRTSQRQVIAYLAPDLVAALKRRAGMRGLTLRETLALAVNAELAAMGVPPALTPERQRRFTRVRGAAAPRGEACDTPVRRNRVAIAGWFDRTEAIRLRDLAAEMGRTVQGIAEAGAERLARDEPDPAALPGEAAVTVAATAA